MVNIHLVVYIVAITLIHKRGKTSVDDIPDKHAGALYLQGGANWEFLYSFLGIYILGTARGWKLD